MQLNQVLRACNYEIDGGSAGSHPFRSAKTRTVSLCAGKVHCVFSQASRVTLEVRVHADPQAPAIWLWRDPQYDEAIKAAGAATEQNDTRRVHSAHEALSLLLHASLTETSELVDTQLDLEDDLVLELYTQAHQKDMTLNELVNHIMQEMVERHKQATIATKT